MTSTDKVGVLDTNTLILIKRVDPKHLPSEPVITVVTLAELSVGPLVATDDAERAARQSACSRPKRPSSPFRSTLRPLARSAA